MSPSFFCFIGYIASGALGVNIVYRLLTANARRAAMRVMILYHVGHYKRLSTIAIGKLVSNRAINEMGLLAEAGYLTVCWEGMKPGEVPTPDEARWLDKEYCLSYRGVRLLDSPAVQEYLCDLPDLE